MGRGVMMSEFFLMRTLWTWLTTIGMGTCSAISRVCLANSTRSLTGPSGNKSMWRFLDESAACGTRVLVFEL